MQFLEKEFQPSEWYILVPTGIESLAELIRARIDLSMAFVVYQGDDINSIDAPIVWHSGKYKEELLAPIVSYPDEESYRGDENGRKVYMLDVENKNPKIMQVPTGVPLVGMRDSYRYQFAMQKFYTNQSVEQLLDWLRRDKWEDFLYTRENTWPMDFTPISELRNHLQKI